jgi:ubiquitin C-terminal hydrolase
MPTNKLLAMPAHVLSTVLKPAGIENLGNTCYISTLMQIIFRVVPLRKRLMEKKL